MIMHKGKGRIVEANIKIEKMAIVLRRAITLLGEIKVGQYVTITLYRLQNVKGRKGFVNLGPTT